MPHYLSDEELRRTAPAEVASFKSPVPTQIVSNGEFNPLPQTREQQRVEARIKELADDFGRRHGMNRRQFLASSAGMAAAFLAMNEVFGPIFDVSRAEAADPGVAVILMDVVLGYGAHPDPAGEMAPALRKALDIARRQRRALALVGFVCGTDEDPQGLARQEAVLREAGMLLESSKARAARLAARLVA